MFYLWNINYDNERQLIGLQSWSVGFSRYTYIAEMHLLISLLYRLRCGRFTYQKCRQCRKFVLKMQARCFTDLFQQSKLMYKRFFTRWICTTQFLKALRKLEEITSKN